MNSQNEYRTSHGRIIRPPPPGTQRALTLEEYPRLVDTIQELWDDDSQDGNPWGSDATDGGLFIPPPYAEEDDEDERIPEGTISVPSPPSSQDLFGHVVATPTTTEQGDDGPADRAREVQKERQGQPQPRDPVIQNFLRQQHQFSRPPVTSNMSNRRAQPERGAITVGGEDITEIGIVSIKLESLPKLASRDDYQKWFRSMEVVMEMCNAYDYMPGQSLDVQEKVPERHIAKWKTSQRKGTLVIRNTMSTTLGQMAMGQDTVAKLFQWAKKQFDDDGVAALPGLAERWETATLENFTTVRLLGEEITNIQEGYARVGAEHRLPESFLTVHFVRGLGKAGKPWKAWVQVFWTTHTAKLPELTEVISLAEAEEARQGVGDQSGTSGTNALVAREHGGRGRKRAATETPLDGEDTVLRRVKKCSHCKKMYHNKSECWELHPELKKDKKAKDRKSSTDKGTTALLAHRGKQYDSDTEEVSI